MLIECQAIRVCPLAHAIDDNMSTWVIVFDPDRRDAFQRTSPTQSIWKSLTDGKSYSKTRDGVFEVA